MILIDQSSIFLQKRVVVRDQDYFTYPVGDTSFSLGIALPRGYGKYKVNGQIELSLKSKEYKYNGESYVISIWFCKL